MARTGGGERFFFLMALAMLVIILIGFGSRIALTPQGAKHLSPIVIAHGAVFLCWFVLFAVQARLIGRGGYTLHRKLGIASLTLAALMLVTGFLATNSAIARPDWSIGGFVGPASAVFPTFDLLTFTPVYILGLWLRKNAAAHKRLMLLAGLMMIDPAAARMGIGLFDNPMIGTLIEAMLFGALLIYDWRSRGRPHWASVVGTVLFFGCMAARFAVWSSDGWPQFALALYG